MAEEHWKREKAASITVALIGVLAYYLIVLKDFQNPDAYLEGFLLYDNAVWATACGRWLLRYLELGTFNVVMPLFVVMGYLACTAVSVCLTLRLLRIEKMWSVIGVSAVMTAAPAVIDQLTYTYMALAYSFSMLLCVLWLFFAERRGKTGWGIAASFCLCMALGLYQAYIGAAVGLAVIMLVLKAHDDGVDKKWFGSLFRYLWTGFLGAVFYLIAMKADTVFYSQPLSNRAENVGFLDMLTKFPKRFLYTYQCFIEYIKDWRMKRNLMYALLLLLLIAVAVIAIVRLLRQKKWKECVVIVTLLLLLPPALNCIAFICTDDPVRNLMTHQTVLIMPFCLSLWERCHIKKVALYLELMTAALCILIGWTYVVNANMTYRCWDLSNRRIRFVSEDILSRVMKMPEYSDGKRIVFAGFIEDSTLRENYYMLYQYAIGLPESVVWWKNPGGLYTTQKYLLMNFGLDSGTFLWDEYIAAIDSEEFAVMEVYPAQSSIAEINGIIIVKLSENPPR